MTHTLQTTTEIKTRVFGMGAGQWHVTFPSGTTSYILEKSGEMLCDFDGTPSCQGCVRRYLTHSEAVWLDKHGAQYGWGNALSHNSLKRKCLDTCTKFFEIIPQKHSCGDYYATREQYDACKAKFEAKRNEQHEGWERYQRVCKFTTFDEWYSFLLEYTLIERSVGGKRVPVIDYEGLVHEIMRSGLPNGRTGKITSHLELNAGIAQIIYITK